jgi:hypothetical protein
MRIKSKWQRSYKTTLRETSMSTSSENNWMNTKFLLIPTWTNSLGNMRQETLCHTMSLELTYSDNSMGKKWRCLFEIDLRHTIELTKWIWTMSRLCLQRRLARTISHMQMKWNNLSQEQLMNITLNRNKDT